jgi:hypothetical protein
MTAGSRFPELHNTSLNLRVTTGWAALVLIIGFTGCSTSYVVAPVDEGGDYSIDQLSSEVDGRDASIKVRSRKSDFDGSEIAVRGDSLIWIEPVYESDPKTLGRIRRGETRQSVHLEEVERISLNNHFVGAAEGLGLGALGGAVVGLIGGLLYEPGGHEDFTGLAIFALSGMAGAAAGLVTGAVIGHSYEYEFPPPDAPVPEISKNTGSIVQP